MDIERYKNQHRLVNQDRLANTRFLVIGAGSVGGFTVQTLAKMGAQNITVFDPDRIEKHNVSNQLYPNWTIGGYKVDALKKIILRDLGVSITAIPDTWDRGTLEYDIVISSVDNMATRKALWDYYRDKQRPSLFIDPRMGGQVFRVYSVNPRNKNHVLFYEKTLYSDEKALKERCGQKNIIYTVLGISSVILNNIKKHIMNQKVPAEIAYDFLTGNQIIRQ